MCVQINNLTIKHKNFEFKKMFVSNMNIGINRSKYLSSVHEIYAQVIDQNIGYR